MTESELQNILTSVKGADSNAMDAAKRRQAQLAKPPGSLGRLEEISVRLAGITGKVKNILEKRRILVFCADNGVVAEGVAVTPQSVTLSQAVNMTKHRTGMSALPISSATGRRSSTSGSTPASAAPASSTARFPPERRIFI